MNWLTDGWGKYTSDSTPPSLTVDYKNLIKNADLQQSANSTISQIKEQHNSPLLALASGGIDSQAMLWVLKQSGHDFKVCSFRLLIDGVVYNAHDLIQLEQFCKINNLSIEYHDLDIIDVLENKLETYAIRYQCTSPQLITHMAMADSLPKNTTKLFSGNFAYQSIYTYSIYGLLRYAKTCGHSVIPYFLSHTADLSGCGWNFAQILRDAIISDRKNSTTLAPTSYEWKISTMQSIGIPIIPQKEKYTGFENIKSYYDNKVNLLSQYDKIKYMNMPSKRNFDILFRYRLGEMVDYVDKVNYVNNEFLSVSHQ